MPSFRSLPRLFALLALFLAATGCDERDPSSPPASAVPSGLRVLGGDGQHAVVGAPLSEELAVDVVDASNTPLAGIPVRFAVVSGGGQLSTQTATSDARGVARFRWTLGTVAADSQVVEARLEPPLMAAVRLRAHARADAPAALAAAAGNGAAGRVGAALADSLAVTVKDRLGNPIVGLEVSWAVAAGGGALSPARTVTGAGGVAKAAWTLGPRVDSAQVALARVAGLDSVAFVANAVTAGVPLQLAKRGGDGQRGAAGSVLLDSLGVSLRMADGRPVVGALVTWRVPPAGGTVTPAVSRTDANGAASAVWRLGTAPGLMQATATVDSGTLVFTALTQAAAPAALAPVAGGGGEGPVGGALADSLAVRVTDAYGNPVPGAEVAWSALSGGGSVQPARSAAGADGIARAQWVLGPEAGTPQSARAAVGTLPPVAFNAQGVTRGVVLQLARRGGDGQRGPVGSVLLDSLGVVLRLPDGRPVAGVEVAWSVAFGGGSVSPASSRTDANGAASAVWQLGMSPGLARVAAQVEEGTLFFTALAGADVPATLEKVGGDGASGGVGQALADSLAVRVTDRHGNPAAGATVAWSVPGGGGSVSPEHSTADSLGIARTRWTLGTAVGTGHAVRAVTSGVPPATFSATGVTAGVPLQLAKRGGDGQQGAAGSVLADSLSVVLRLPDGRPVPGALVAWSVVSGGGSISPASSRTDALGQASAAWQAGTTTGLFQAAAKVDEGTLLFTALTQADAPAALEIVGGNGGTGGVGQVLADSLAVRVTDRFGNPVPGARVSWADVSGGGSPVPAQSTADGQGIARTRWTLGAVADSVQTLSARAGTAAPVAFQATATLAGVGLQLTQVSGSGQTGQPGSVLADSLVVQVRTPAGQAVRNAPVTWTTTGGTLSPAASRTDSRGQARAAWTLGSTWGLAQATATSGASKVTFSGTVAGSGAAVQVQVIEGDSATLVRGTRHGVALRVTNAQGTPIPNAIVSFLVLQGGGHLYAESDVTVTEANGIAVADWVVGPQPGLNRLRVRVEGADDVILTATAVDANLRLVLTYPNPVTQLTPVPNSTAHAYQGMVLAAVADPSGNWLIGLPIEFVPNNGEAPGVSVTTDMMGEAEFYWLGRWGEGDGIVPELRIRFEGQEVRVRAAWDAGQRVYVPDLFWFLERQPFAAGTTVQFTADVREWNGVSVPIGLPVVLKDERGWRVETVAGAQVSWPVGPAGTRTLTFCIIDEQHCDDFSVQVQ